METIKDKIKKEQFSNWVKSILGLDRTKKAVQEYVKEKFITYIKRKCLLKNYQSFLTDDELNHIENGSSLLTNLERSVTFKHYLWVWSSKDTCNGTYLCKSSFEKIITLHREYIPGKGLMTKTIYWGNNKNAIGISLEWAIAKIFMPQGNESNTDPNDTDPSAMFHLMSVCDLFSNNIKLSHLKKLKEARNALCHSKDNTVEDHEVIEYFNHMECVLTDASYDMNVRKNIRDRLKEDIKNIEKLKTCTITVSMFDDALKLKRKQIYCEFEKKVQENDPEQLMELLNLVEQNREYIKEVKKYPEYLKNVDAYTNQVSICKEQMEVNLRQLKEKEAENIFISIVIFLLATFILSLFPLETTDL